MSRSPKQTKVSSSLRPSRDMTT